MFEIIKFSYLDHFQLQAASMHDSFGKFGFSFFERHFFIIWNVQDQKTILFDTEKLTFEFSIDFENFENFQFFSFFIIFGVRLAYILDVSFLPEHFSFKMQASWHHCTWGKIMLIGNELSNIFQNFIFRPQKM